MKRFLSTLVAAVLLLGLGVLVYMSAPNNTQQAIAPNPIALAAPQAMSVAAPDAETNWFAIAMGLDALATIPNAQALVDAIPGTQQVLRWDASIQNFDFYLPGGAGGDNFDTMLGEAYLVLVDSAESGVFTLVGDVPSQSGQIGAVQFSLVGGSPCQWNYISMPLDKGDILTAQDLADAIGDAEQILMWDASVQNFDFYLPEGGGNDFATQIGYPYWVCMGQSKVWPQ